MQENISPEQTNQLKSWVEQRDTILLELSNLKKERDEILVKNKELANSNTDIQETILKSIGRMEELNKREKEYEEIVSTKLLDLSVQKSELQTEISSLLKEIDTIKDSKKKLIDDIQMLTEVHSKVFDRISVLDEIVGQVTKVSEFNKNEIELIVTALKKTIGDSIEITDKNIANTKEILDKLPILFFELQRKALIRQTL